MMGFARAQPILPRSSGLRLLRFIDEIMHSVSCPTLGYNTPMNQSINQRFFYHSFPRRGASTQAENAKGCKILASIRDFGLLLTPQFIEWTQPTATGRPRVLPVLQKRVCFTELSPNELTGHSEKFGHFSLEFEVDAVRRLGAIPVFYVPQPSAELRDGSAMGTALLAIATDLRAVVNRMAGLDGILHGTTPVPDSFQFTVGFAGSPEGRGSFTINRDESKNFLRAMGHAVTPWKDLSVGADTLLNFFHPTDDTRSDKALEFYREREWRVACSFRINNPDGSYVEVLHVPTLDERQRFLEIDPEFFSRQVSNGINMAATLDQALVYPALNGKRIIEMVRRVVVPPDAVADATDVLSSLESPPPVVSSADLK
ncbi:MAG: hypothetical protein WAL80_23400 [Xanthobacteraceae bacterium]